MKIVVGLGNPGTQYATTRHNIGVRVVERFAIDHGIAMRENRFESRFGLGSISVAPPQAPEALDLDVALLVPQTFMNRSGAAVAHALGDLPVDDIASDLLVVVDDLDLPFGRLRIRPKGSSAGHRGLEDIAERIGSRDFPRLRFGIGRPETEIETIDWVLEAFSSAEETALEDRVPLAAEAVHSILFDGLVASMNRYNRGPEAED
jgi:PTH1 family peptidyl-tRNA hydrolase